jgi:two-component sensor histidine kinase
MATTPELARYYTTLEAGAVDHLQRLVGSWGLLADLSFADLLLWARVDPGRKVPGVAEEADGAAERLVVLGQVRPLTSQTLFRTDWMGDVISVDVRPMVMRALRLGELIEGEVIHPSLREPIRVQCIPVRYESRTIAVMTRESAQTASRHPGELERVYIEVFNRFLRMIVTGQFPFVGEALLGEEAPRVGDGAIVLDAAGRVEYASPNAISALHRLGVHANTEGMRLTDLGLHEHLVRPSFATATPTTEEVEKGPEVTVLVRCLPLVEHGSVTGGVVLLRDISELRRRDRLLLSKDATIREIHHRVKNNLQTISSLLRLQARRLKAPEAKAALEESVRRIRSIALVHETLSHAAGDDVPFLEVVRPLVRMVEEGLVGPEHPVRFKVTGDAGNLPATVATSLSVVLNELLQNVVDHAYPASLGSADGNVALDLDNDGRKLRITVTDDGAGVPPGFNIAVATGLGLSIVRTLITTDLAGTIEVSRGRGPDPRPGTVVALAVPVGEGSVEPHDPPLHDPPSRAHAQQAR